ncbi:hypothetical protein [Bacillus sonorensis]|uniref:hypothetical protein n=1 Tax=Bacillus sonorensis TaxID=119858 RepID=UPI0040594436
MFKQRLIEALTIVTLIGLSVACGFTGYFLAKILLTIPVIGVIIQVGVSTVAVFIVALIICDSANRLRDAYRKYKHAQKDVEEETQ